MKRHLTIGSPLLRYSRDYDAAAEYVDGLPNYYHVVRPDSENEALPLLSSGINPIGRVKGPDGTRVPAILLRSSPHKVGSLDTPWLDVLEPDAGYAIYYGDNKVEGTSPMEAGGNKALLELAFHQSPLRDVRALAAPLLFFRAERHQGRVKGHVSFQGYGIIGRVQLVSQLDRRGHAFANIALHCAIFSSAFEHELFDWGWINARRNSARCSLDCVEAAPWAWRRWVEHGTQDLESCRRRLVRLELQRAEEQLPQTTEERGALKEVLAFYSAQRHRFKLLAAEVAARVFRESGARFHRGWITPRSGDGAIDFVGRLDLGPSRGAVRVVVLGQAKCEVPNKPTSGREVARTVARLQRGWIGAYVTTSFFSERVQREIIDDQYPVLLVNGGRLVRELIAMSVESGCTPREMLRRLDASSAWAISARRPEDITSDVLGIPMDAARDEAVAPLAIGQGDSPHPFDDA